MVSEGAKMRRSLVWLLAALPLASCGSEPPVCPRPPTPISSAPPPPPAAPVIVAEPEPAPQKDGRLAPLAAPVKYAVSLEIDPNQDRFSGKVQITVQVPEPTTFIVLHARDITVAR